MGRAERQLAEVQSDRRCIVPYEVVEVREVVHGMARARVVPASLLRGEGPLAEFEGPLRSPELVLHDAQSAQALGAPPSFHRCS